MDLQLAAYKANKYGFSDAKPFEHPFKKRAEVAMADTHQYNRLLKKLRHGARRDTTSKWLFWSIDESTRRTKHGWLNMIGWRHNQARPTVGSISSNP